MPINIEDRSSVLMRRPPRPHPYEQVRHDARGQYHDFKTNPDLIDTVLEDFTPHDTNPGVQRFYALLKHINRQGALFETTDCGLSQTLYRSANSPFPDKAGWVGGRVILMWRELDRNCRQEAVGWLLKQLLRRFRRLEKRYDHIGVVVGPFPTVFRMTGRRGYQVDVEFAMWGDSFEEAMQRFPDVVSVLDASIRKCEANYYSKF
jgi:hypothetical protein